ncbi:MAG: hypothetical protein HFE49_02710 [Clostridia bacterium]|nr:hypothetical protein [Clostridia bacterium]
MYTVTEEKKTIENKNCLVYGIRYDDEYYVKDVSADKAKVKHLTEMYNRYGLSPTHLYEAVENFLNEI